MVCKAVLCVVSVAMNAAAFELIVADSYRKELYRLADLDGSGVVEPDEVTVVYGGSAAGPKLSTPNGLAVAGDVLYLLDGGTLDMILRLEDRDGDGTFMGEDEAAAFTWPGCGALVLRTPNRLVHREGEFTVVDNSRVRSQVVRLRDLDGDGSACGPGEWETLFAGIKDQAPDNMEALCVLDDGSILVADATEGGIWRLAPPPGGGALEASPFLVPPAGAPVPRFACLCLHEGKVAAADRNSGIILMMHDADGDGRIGAGEVREFFAPSPSVPALIQPRDMWSDSAGRLWVVDSGTDQVVVLQDRNGDGDARGPGEALVVLRDASVLAVPTALALVVEPHAADPAIESLSHGAGDARGGDVVEIHGSGFVPGSEVFFGPLPVPWVEWLSATRLRAATPPGAGRVAVTVASVYGAALMQDAWEYIGETLRIDAMTPEAGPAGGGIEVTFTGAGLGLADVWFDGIPADVRLRTDAMLVVVAPPRAAGAVDVLVGDGISLAVLRFEYVSAGGVFVRGDVDADGAIAINDAILILSILFAGEPPPSCEDRADVNDDGALNIADAIRLLGYLFGGGEPPPPPFPDPGPDPTEDELVCP